MCDKGGADCRSAVKLITAWITHICAIAYSETETEGPLEHSAKLSARLSTEKPVGQSQTREL